MVTSQSVISATALVFGINVTDIILSKDRYSSSRDPVEVRARQCAAYILRFRCKLTYQEISECVGYSDHSTAMYAVQAAFETAERRPEFSLQIKSVGELLHD